MTLVYTQPPIPNDDSVVRRVQRPGDPIEKFLITEPWQEYFDDQSTVLNQTPRRINSVVVSDSEASIGATDFSGGTLPAGLYRAAYYARITQAAGTSSSLEVTLDWTDHSISCSYTGAAMTGNTTATLQSQTLLIYIDAVSPVRYSTTYASVGSPVMSYSIYFTLERVSN
jgi:hypothetical protein